MDRFGLWVGASRDAPWVGRLVLWGGLVFTGALALQGHWLSALVATFLAGVGVFVPCLLRASLEADSTDPVLAARGRATTVETGSDQTGRSGWPPGTSARTRWLLPTPSDALTVLFLQQQALYVPSTAHELGKAQSSYRAVVEVFCAFPLAGLKHLRHVKTLGKVAEMVRGHLLTPEGADLLGPDPENGFGHHVTRLAGLLTASGHPKLVTAAKRLEEALAHVIANPWSRLA